MIEPLYHYAVNEILIEGLSQKLVSCAQFRAEEATLLDCKMDAEKFYSSKRKRIDYWMMLGIYEISKRQEFELTISLVETHNGKQMEYITRSIINPIPQVNKEYEKKVLNQFPNNVNSWCNVNSQQDIGRVETKPFKTIQRSTLYLRIRKWFGL